MLLIYFSQNGHFWNGVGSANNISQSHPQESTEQSTGSCDKKCSGSVSGFHLTGETHSYTLDFVVKKGRVTMKDVTVVPHTTTTTTPTSPASEPGGTDPGSGASEGSSCPSGFRQVCSMVGSCPLGSKPVCPRGRKESGNLVLMRSSSNCRCVPFFLLGNLDRVDMETKALESEAGSAQTTNFLETTRTSSTVTGCLCVDQGPSRLDQLTFNETGQTHVQEQIFIGETGILGNESIKL